MSIEQEEIFSDDGLFGTVICKECHTIWVKEFVPEFCTKCGVRVAAVRGEGEERMISLVERVYPPAKIVACPQCGERYFKKACPEKCLRCWGDLRSIRRANWLIHLFRRLEHI